MISARFQGTRMLIGRIFVSNTRTIVAAVLIVSMPCALACPATAQEDAESATSPPKDLLGKRAGEERSDNELKMRFCWCPAGRFLMGSPKTEPDRSASREGQVEVSLSHGFWLGKYEVTREEWERLMPAPKIAKRKGRSRPSPPPTETDPVAWISWGDAVEFCERLSALEQRSGRLPRAWTYRLPTEAQWEYACRAGTTSATAFGETLSSDQANFNGHYPYNGAAVGPYLGHISPVGKYKSNDWGLHDMHGNVWEWCHDWFGSSLPGGKDPILDELEPDPRNERVMRGGDWYGKGFACRSAMRGNWSPEHAGAAVGFRVALVATAAK